MAIDQAIAEATASGQALPTVRFYEWHPPCLSLGRSQPLAEADVALCAQHGLGVARRPSGGRAILHADELTYSVAGPAADARLMGGVLEVYARISIGLLQGLRALGVPADTSSSEARVGPEASAACFDVPSAHEITVGGRKLIGSAQCRQGGWVLQHGSLPLRGDVAQIVDVLSFAHEAEREALRAALHLRAVSLADVLGRDVSPAEAAASLAEGLAAALNVTWLPAGLSSSEQARAAELREATYGSLAWTNLR